MYLDKTRVYSSGHLKIAFMIMFAFVGAILPEMLQGKEGKDPEEVTNSIAVVEQKAQLKQPAKVKTSSLSVKLLNQCLANPPKFKEVKQGEESNITPKQHKDYCNCWMGFMKKLEVSQKDMIYNDYQAVYKAQKNNTKKEDLGYDPTDYFFQFEAKVVKLCRFKLQK